MSNWRINSGLVNHFHFNWMNRLMSVDRCNWLLLRDMYVDTRDIQEHILFAKHCRGEQLERIFSTLLIRFSQNMKLAGNSVSVRALMQLHRIKGLIAHIRQKNPDTLWTHCVIHREALASKMSPELKSILNDAVKAINFIKSRPLNACLFRRLCDGMGSEHTELLLHTEVRWLSKGKVLNRLFELRSVDFCKTMCPLLPLYLRTII